jgi:hypothetical protein
MRDFSNMNRQIAEMMELINNINRQVFEMMRPLNTMMTEHMIQYNQFVVY